MRSPWSVVALALVAAVATTACATGIRTNVVAEAPPVPESRDISFLEDDGVGCEFTKIGDLRVPVSAWPSVRPEAEQKVREMGGEAVVAWKQRAVMVGGTESGAPGGATDPRRKDFWFGVVVRFPGECPEA